MLALSLFSLAWGATLGSFLNVVIYRVPRGQSLSFPGSRCGTCGTPIRWYDNVPLLSYLVLRGRCRACKAPYSPLYFLIEAACGVLSLALLRQWVFPLNPETFLTDLATWAWWVTFALALVAVAFIDLAHTIVPDEITFPMVGFGLFGAFALPRIDGLSALMGAGAGAGFVLLMAGFGYLVFRREAMGFGDVKLLAMVGAFLGWKSLPFVFFASAAQALIATLVARLYRQLTGKTDSLVLTTAQLDARFGEDHSDLPSHQAVPYGPFVALAALQALLFGDELLWDLSDALVRGLFSLMA